MRRVGGALAVALVIGLIVPASLGALPWSTAQTDPVDPIGAPLPTAATADTVETGPDDVATADGDWSRLVFNASGPGGSWAYAYQPLPEPVDSIGLDVSYDLIVEDAPGEDVTAFLAGPMPAVDDGDGFHVLDYPLEPPITIGSGGIDRSVDRRFGLGVGSGEITGVGVAVGADRQWNISVEVVRPDADGPTTRPSYEYVNASGFHIYKEAERLVPTVDDGVTRVTLSDRIRSKGWSTMQVLYDVVQPVEVRSLRVEFPDGTSYWHRGDRQGYSGAGCGATGGGGVPPVLNGLHDIYGTYADIPGPFEGDLVDAGGMADISLVAVHAAIEPEDLPVGHSRDGFVSRAFLCDGTR